MVLKKSGMQSTFKVDIKGNSQDGIALPHRRAMGHRTEVNGGTGVQSNPSSETHQ